MHPNAYGVIATFQNRRTMQHRAFGPRPTGPKIQIKSFSNSFFACLRCPVHYLMYGRIKGDCLEHAFICQTSSLGGLQGIWENMYVIWSVTPRASKDLMVDHGNGSEMNKACIQCVFISTLLFYSCSNHVESYSKTILVCFAYSIDVLILHPKLRFWGHTPLRPNAKHFQHSQNFTTLRYEFMWLSELKRQKQLRSMSIYYLQLCFKTTWQATVL